MRRLRTLLSMVPFAAMLLAVVLPTAAAAQELREPPTPEPLPPVCPATADCWWPVTRVAQLDSLDLQLDIADGFVRADYRLRFSNPALLFDSRSRPDIRPPTVGAEGRVILPLPPGSSVADLTLSGGPETLEGALLDADQATRIYEEIVRRQIDPALLRSLGDDLYEVRAFPVPPGETREVRFTVTTPLVADDDRLTIEVPWSRMSPRPSAATLAVEIDVPWEVRSALAPGLELETERLGPGRLTLSWESAEEWRPVSDLRLYLTGGEGMLATRLLAHRLPREDGYFALLLAPALEVDERVARDLVLVLDRSGSMEGEKLAQAQRAAAYVLDRLGTEDRFAVVDFARDVRSFDSRLRGRSEAGEAIDYVERLRAGGGTNIAAALESGLELLDGERPATVIFLTDGLPTAGITDTEGILDVVGRSAPGRVQLFSFGVGYDVDTILLDSLASRLVGSSHYVTPDEEIDREVQRLFERVSTPVLTDVEISIEGVDAFDLAPAQITGIFAGSQALLTGRYSGSGLARVVVRGDTHAGSERFVYGVEFAALDRSDPTIAQLWAQRRVGDLLTELRIEGSRDSLVEEIVEIATRFGIVTPFTAYLAEEPQLAFAPAEAARAVGGAAASAPSSGQDAVAGAADLEALREGAFESGGSEVRVAGAHSYYRIADAWARDGYQPGSDAPEVLVGSAAFAELLDADPQLANAAALGPRVVTLAEGGWVTIVWPDALDAEVPVTPTLPRHASSGAPGGEAATTVDGGSAGDILQSGAAEASDYAAPAVALAVVAGVVGLAAWRRVAARR